MAKSKTRGFYTFEDGTTIWFAGLTAAAKKIEIKEHGKIIKFAPTN